MSTLTITSKHKIGDTYESATLTYSVSSTNTQTTLTLSNISLNIGGYYFRVYVDGVTKYTYWGETDTSEGTIPTTITWNKTTASQSKVIKLEIEDGDPWWGTTDITTKTATVTVPALASYTVSYNANGHGTKPSNQTKYYGKALTLAAAITATGFTFVRWNTKADNSGTGYAAKASYTGNAALTLYAIWNHSITFNVNGGSGSQATQTALATSAITIAAKSSTVVRTGYNFTGWNTKADGSGTAYAVGETLAAGAASITLYAQWSLITYTVTYNANGHGTAPSSQTKEYGKALTLKSAISATGYTFVRWNTNSSNTGTGYNAGASYTGNAALTLYAIWNHSITYNANGGSGAPATQTSLATSAITRSTTQPTRDGYIFTGWNTKADGSGTAPSSLASGGASITLYAQWQPAITSVTIGSITLRRVATSGASDKTAADEGEYAYIKVPYTVQGQAAAAVSMSIVAEADSGDDPTNLNISSYAISASKTAGNTLSGNFEAKFSGCDVDIRSTFTVTITADNTSYSSQADVEVSKMAILATAFFTMDVKAGGKGVHFGGAATNNGFYVSMDPYFTKNININLSHAPYLKLKATEYDSQATKSGLSSNSSEGRVALYDKNGYVHGVMGAFHTASTDSLRLEMYVKRKNASGTEVANGLYLYVNSDGSRSVSVTDSAIWRSALEAVYKGGDTITGELIVEGSQYKCKSTLRNSAVGQTIPESGEANIGGIQINDNQNYNCGWFRQYKNSNDRTYMQMCLRRKIGDADKVNALSLGINADGTRSVSVSESAPWRAALGAVYTGGDTMTGILTMNAQRIDCKCSNLTRGTFTDSGTTYGNSGVFIRDSGSGTGNTLGLFRAFANTTINGVQMSSLKDSSTANSLSIGWDEDGNPYVHFTYPSKVLGDLGLTPTSGTSNDWGTNNSIRWRKQGNVVTVCYSGTTLASQLTVSSWTTIGQLPEGYRPSLTIYGTAVCESLKPVSLRILGSNASNAEDRGKVQCYPAASTGTIASGKTCYFNVSFVI